MTALLGRHHYDLFLDEGTVAQSVSCSLTSSHIPATFRGRITPETHRIHLSLSSLLPITSSLLHVSYLLLQ